MKHLLIKTLLALAAVAMVAGLLLLRSDVRFSSDRIDDADGAPPSVVRVYFSNTRFDPEVSCYKVFPVNRQLPEGEDPYIYAIRQLLSGPTSVEKAEQYWTSINEGTRFRSLLVDEGVAYVDFDKRLGFEVGGSCRVGAIRAQITETLKQFEGIKDVVISIEGESEEILQP